MKNRKTYTAAYSMKAGRDGRAGDEEPLHIVELQRSNSGRWTTMGIALCGVYVERQGNRIVAAQGKGVEHASCRLCKFERQSVAEKTKPHRVRESGRLQRNRKIAQAKQLLNETKNASGLADTTTVQ